MNIKIQPAISHGERRSQLLSAIRHEWRNAVTACGNTVSDVLRYNRLLEMISCGDYLDQVSDKLKSQISDWAVEFADI
jgi:hypothetical protein